MIEFFTQAPIYVLAFLAVITVVVFVHELGHFMVARAVGVRVEVFSIGFGKELFGFNDRRGTRWKFGLLPLGGYVKMFGESDDTVQPDGTTRPLTETERAGSFAHKSLARRSAVVVAGPVANYIFAILVLGILYLSYGQPFTAPVVGEVQADSVAAEIGLQTGDRIVAIDGNAVESFQDVAETVQFGLGVPLELTIERDGESQTIPAVPSVVEITDNFGNVHRVGRLGIGPAGETETRTFGPLAAFGAATAESWNTSGRILESLWQIIEGTRSADELGGVIRIGKMAGDIAKEGIVQLIGFAAFISIMLGLFNLFPIPMLDGGHLAFYAYEAVRGRPMAIRAQEWAFRVGLVFLVGLTLFAIRNDLKLFDFFKNLLT
ncbi:MAG: RIP metalloprotease RseP [Rhodospirillaceae bacterium]|nr:RIP metalloprotease RseP [Rhodospirillaceae bacterium]